MCSVVNENIKNFNRLARPIDDKRPPDVIFELNYVANMLNGSVSFGERAQLDNIRTVG